MNAQTREFRSLAVAAAAAQARPVADRAPARREDRVRDFGVGYGNSSGYASIRRYASSRSQPLFRCA